MKTLAALGIAGGFLLVAPEWLVLLVVLKTASRLSTGLSVAVLKEVLNAGIVR